MRKDLRLIRYLSMSAEEADLSVLQLCNCSSQTFLITNCTEPDQILQRRGRDDREQSYPCICSGRISSTAAATRSGNESYKGKKNKTACVFHVAERYSDAVWIYKFAALMQRDGPPHAWRLVSHQRDESKKFGKLLRCLASLRAR